MALRMLWMFHPILGKSECSYAFPAFLLLWLGKGGTFCVLNRILRDTRIELFKTHRTGTKVNPIAYHSGGEERNCSPCRLSYLGRLTRSQSLSDWAIELLLLVSTVPHKKAIVVFLQTLSIPFPTRHLSPRVAAKFVALLCGYSTVWYVKSRLGERKTWLHLLVVFVNRSRQILE